MTKASDQELLRDYSVNRSEAAFGELVRRHIDFVYSIALRMVREPQLAQDVTQGVFMALARSAAQLLNRPILAGWLHRTAQNIAAQTVRTEVRRRAREQEAAAMNELLSSDSNAAWAQISPHLDAALGELSEADRDAVLLRYFQRKSAEEMAGALGISAEAAQKRVSRAVERLREFFAKRGLTVGAGGLAAVFSVNAVEAAPADLAALVTKAVLTGTTALTAAAATTSTAIVMTAFQKIAIAAVLAASVATPLAIQHRAQARLRDENEGLREQLKQQGDVVADNERLSHLLFQASQTNSQGLQKAQMNELLRLRSEVGQLRAQARELAQLRVATKAAGDTPASKLRAQLEQMPEKAIPELQLLDEGKWAEDASRAKLDTPEGVREALANLRRAAKIRFVYDMGTALTDYLQANNGQLPNDILDLKPFFKYPTNERPVDDSVFQRYELLQTGNVANVAAGQPVIGEKAPVDDDYDTSFKLGVNGYTMQGTGKWSGQAVATNLWTTAATSPK